MSNRRTAPRIALWLAVLTMVASIIGFVATLILHSFVLDKFNAYGEVPIPGNATLHLPAGETTVSFHTYVTRSPSGGFPVPPLEVTIVPPDGVPQPQLTESRGTTTTVNSDTRVRVWVAHIPVEGSYRIVTGGQVNGYINPQLAFGHGSSYGWLVWSFVALFVVSLFAVFGAVLWSTRVARRPRLVGGSIGAPPGATPWETVPAPPPDYAPTDDGIRIEQLKTLAALRDSGALTPAEFEAEKRRILDG
jgi:Short C-terminal domain